LPSVGATATFKYHTGLDGTIPLPEIEAALALADLYEQVEFASIL
jgi:hypothetical protein